MSRLVGEYLTRTGQVGAQIVERFYVGASAPTYSYTGKWGAGSGHGAPYMHKMIAEWLRTKKGVKIITPFSPSSGGDSGSARRRRRKPPKRNARGRFTRKA